MIKLTFRVFWHHLICVTVRRSIFIKILAQKQIIVVKNKKIDFRFGREFISDLAEEFRFGRESNSDLAENFSFGLESISEVPSFWISEVPEKFSLGIESVFLIYLKARN